MLFLKKMLGYIQYNSIQPFKVHIMKEELLRFYHRNPSNLHLDATGSVVRRVNQKDVYCYALVAADQEGSFPLAVMISNSHTTVTISHFLQHVNAVYKRLTKKTLMPPAFITDFSWAMLNAGMLALNQTSLKDYLSECWRQVDENGAIDRIPFFLCRAHIAKGFSNILKTHVHDKRVRQGYMWLLTKLAECDDLQTMKERFKEICQIAHNRTAPPESVSTHDGEEEDDGDRIPQPAAPSKRKTLRDTTPFGVFFSEIAQGIPPVTPDADGSNPFFAPGLIKHLLTTYMPLAPMWSNILQKSTKLMSNACVESFFKTVKHSLLRGKTHLYAGDFVRSMIKNMAARIKLNLMNREKRSHIPGREKRKACKSATPRLKRDRVDEEIWSRKKRRRTTYSSRKEAPDILK